MRILRFLKYLREKSRTNSEFKTRFDTFRRLATEAGNRMPVEWDDRFPCLDDETDGLDFDRHYVYHMAWAMRVLTRTMPELHVDVSSRLDFAALASAIVPVQLFEYRQPDLVLDQLQVMQGDLLNLPVTDSSVHSLSCMHVIEHVGLGRYGDQMDADGDMKAIAELKRVLAPGGQLLFVVPIGRPRVQFNAHRIYSFEHVRKQFSGFELAEFALIPDKAQDGHLVFNASPELCSAQNYGCGCFLFRKPT
ncbi:MAG: DUF268 domain-containing protein [Planctomycetota bacterium]